MNWSKSPPQEDGYYWHRDGMDLVPVIRTVYRGRVLHGIRDLGEVELYGGEFAGPIPEPGLQAEEPKE